MHEEKRCISTVWPTFDNETYQCCSFSFIRSACQESVQFFLSCMAGTPGPLPSSVQVTLAFQFIGAVSVIFYSRKLKSREAVTSLCSCLSQQQSRVASHKLILPHPGCGSSDCQLCSRLSRTGVCGRLENALGAGCYCEKSGASSEHVLTHSFSSLTENLVQGRLLSFISL